MKKNKYILPVLAALGVYTLWGFSFLASTKAQSAASPFIILMYRFVIASVIVAVPWMLGKKKVRLKGKNIKGLFWMCLCEPVVYFIGEQYGLKYTSSSFSGIMIAIIPIVTLIMAAAILKDRPTRAQWLFSLLSIAGVIAITLANDGGGGETRLGGIAFLVVAVLCGAGYSVLSRGISDDFSVYERTLLMQLMGAVFFTGAAVIENIGDLTVIFRVAADPNFILPALYLALGASVAGYSLFNYAVGSAPMANIISLCNLTTVISVLAGVFILHEPFSVLSAVSMAVILVGIWGVQRFGRKEQLKEPAK